jgi:Zn-dependent protease with chaperone function
MYVAGLVAPFLLLVAGLAGLLFFGYIPLAFAWHQWLVFFGLGAAVYAWIWLTGRHLNRECDAAVAHFLGGTRPTLQVDPTTARTFDWLMLTLLPFLVYLLLFGLYSTLTFAVWGFDWLHELKGSFVALFLGLGLGLMVAGTLVATLVGFFRLLVPRAAYAQGITVTSAEQPRLWAVANEVAAAVRATPLDRIIVVPSPEIGVYLAGNPLLCLVGRGRRTLQLGLVATHELDVGALKAVLAHEYGHLSCHDSQWGWLAYAMGSGLLAALTAMPRPKDAWEVYQSLSLVPDLSGLNPMYWLLVAYVRLYFRVTSGFQRLREIMADVHALQAYGGDALYRGLLLVGRNQELYRVVLEPQYMAQFVPAGERLRTFAALTDKSFHGLDAEGLQGFTRHVLAAKEPADPYDTHPPPGVRLEYAAKFSADRPADDTVVAELIDDWDRLNEQAAQLYDRAIRRRLRAAIS